MTVKEEFLKIKTKEEFEKKVRLVNELDLTDKEVYDHLVFLDSLTEPLENNGFVDGFIIECREKSTH